LEIVLDDNLIPQKNQLKKKITVFQKNDLKQGVSAAKLQGISFIPYREKL